MGPKQIQWTRKGERMKKTGKGEGGGQRPVGVNLDAQLFLHPGQRGDSLAPRESGRNEAPKGLAPGGAGRPRSGRRGVHDPPALVPQ